MLFVLGLGVVSGCQRVTAENIETWKGTAKGPGKLQDAFTSDSVEPELRAHAAVALYALGRGEFVAEQLRQMPPKSRAPVVTALAKLHMQMLERQETTASVQDARQGLFELRAYADDTERKAIDAALLKTVEQQALASGSLGASQSLSMIVEALGAQTAPLLVKLMGQKQAAHADLAELLLKVGDEPARLQASENLAAQARQTRTIEAGTWRALGLLGGPAAVDFLKEQVDKGPWQTSEQAARALQLRPQPQLGDFALARATDPKVHGNVREEMFRLTESCCGGQTLDGLLNVVGSNTDMLVRYRAYEAALNVGGADAIARALDKFPATTSFKPEDVEDFLVKDTVKLGEPALAAVRELLTSPAPLKRLVGVLALEKLGSPAEASHLAPLKADKAVVKGFPASRTVGQEASRVASLLPKGT